MNGNYNSGNLYPCPDCGSMVSIYADKCPHCGRPLVAADHEEDYQESRQRPQKSGASGCGVFFAVVFGIIVAVILLSQVFKVEIVGTIMPLKK